MPEEADDVRPLQHVAALVAHGLPGRSGDGPRSIFLVYFNFHKVTFSFFFLFYPSLCVIFFNGACAGGSAWAASPGSGLQEVVHPDARVDGDHLALQGADNIL